MIVAGIGCRRGAPASDIEAAIRAALTRAQIGADALDVVATIEGKSAEVGIRVAAEKLGVSVVVVPELELAAASDRVETHSERVSRFWACGSVAEAAALAAAGPAANRIVPRIVVGTATCALAASLPECGAMTVHFIGAGPGAADLITVRGRDLIARCPVCLYAGSIIPRDLAALIARPARALSIPRRCRSTRSKPSSSRRTPPAKTSRGCIPAIFRSTAALAEQLRRLDRHGIPYTLTPGVPAFAAAAAALQCELTVPEVAQSVVLTRIGGRASRMPEKEQLATFAESGATLVLHLAIHAVEKIAVELTPFYGATCPAAVVVQASTPEQRILRGTLADIAAKGRGRAHRADCIDHGWPGARRGEFSRQRALRSPTIAAASAEARYERSRSTRALPCRRSNCARPSSATPCRGRVGRGVERRARRTQTGASRRSLVTHRNPPDPHP